METDESLFLRVRGGDLAAFDLLYARYETRLFGYLRALLGDRQDAEEVLHDAFMAALKRPAERLEEGAFRGWLYRIARNLAFNRRRASDRRERHHASATESAEVAAPADRLLETRELDQALAQAVERLPPPLGELYHLRSSGLSYGEIAELVDAPLGTIKSRMFQMVHVLREELSPWIVRK